MSTTITNSMLILCEKRRIEPESGYSEEEARREAARCLQCEDPPCTKACPVHLNIKKYVIETKEGRYRDALETILERLPFPATCGRVCFHPCEDACVRYTHFYPIAIRGIKRFIADQFIDLDWYPEAEIREEERIAVIGSGPTGLTAAVFLARKGYGVDVFEALPEPGGNMRAGIPEYQLPREVLDHEISNIEKAGVKIKTRIRIDSLDSLFEQGYKAVLVAIGSCCQGIRYSEIVAAIRGHPEVPRQFKLATQRIEGGLGLQVAPTTLATSREGIFAAGDVVNGFSQVSEAVAEGLKVAQSIDEYCQSQR